MDLENTVYTHMIHNIYTHDTSYIHSHDTSYTHTHDKVYICTHIHTSPLQRNVAQRIYKGNGFREFFVHKIYEGDVFMTEIYERNHGNVLGQSRKYTRAMSL